MRCRDMGDAERSKLLFKESQQPHLSIHPLNLFALITVDGVRRYEQQSDNNDEAQEHQQIGPPWKVEDKFQTPIGRKAHS
jgi:hypothetical protein